VKAQTDKQIAEIVASAEVAKKQELRKRLSYGGKNFSAWRDELLTELEPQSRIKALHGLGELGANGYAEEAAAAIAEVLKTGTGPDANRSVYEAACSALARLGAAGIPVLESVLTATRGFEPFHSMP
jgi:hypothetical protein